MTSGATTREKVELPVMSFGDHLEELRRRLLRSIVVALVATALALGFQKPLMQVMAGPHRKATGRLHARRAALEAGKSLDEAAALLASLPPGAGKFLVTTSRVAHGLDESLRSVASAAAGEEFRLRLVEHLRRLQALRQREAADGRLLARTRRALDDLDDLLSAAVPAAPYGARRELERSAPRVAELRARLAGWEVNDAAAALTAAERRSAEGALALLESAREGVRSIGGRIRAPLRLLSYTDAFFAHLKVCFLAGLLIGLPWLTYEIWAFIASGLYAHERRAVYPFLPLALLLLVLGGVFAYFVLVPVGLLYLGGYGSTELIEASYTLKDYLSLVVVLMLGMGLVFQVPLLMVLLTRARIIDVASLRRYRRGAIVAAVAVGACLTPPDIVTQLLMAGPLVLLYQVGLWASTRFARRAAREEEQR